MSEEFENCDLPAVTLNLIHQFLQLEADLMRLKMQYKATVAGPGRDGRRVAEFNPRTGQGRILAILKLQPEIEQKELGYLLDMSRQALAELLAKLEKSDFIVRVQSEKDRRSYVVKLTDKGRKVADKLATGAADADDDPLGLGAALNTLSDDEQQQLSDYLARISAAIRERLGESGDPRDDFAEFFREKFFSRHGFDRRDWAKFGFDRAGGFGPGGGFGFDARDRFDGRDPRSRNGGRRDSRNDGRRDSRNDGRFDPRNEGQR